MTKQKVLFLVPWEVKKVNQDDLTKYSANLLIEGEKYWFLRHWKDNNLNIEVRGINEKSKFVLWQKKYLKFLFIPTLLMLKEMRKTDLIFCFHSQLGLPTAFWMKLFGIKKPLVLFDVEGIGRKNRLWQRWLIRRIISKISLLFYFAQIQREDYARYYPQLLEKSEFVHLGIDLSRFQRIRKSKKENYILTIGYQGPSFRDWKTLIKAFNRLKQEIDLVVVGKSKFSTEEIGEEKLPSCVKFVPACSFQELNEYVAGAKLVVLSLPERRHAFAQMTLIQAMSMKKPVVITKVSGVEDYVEDGKTALFCKPNDWQDLKDKIEMLLEDRKSRQEIARSARRLVVRKFNEEKLAENLYRSVKHLCELGN